MHSTVSTPSSAKPAAAKSARKGRSAGSTRATPHLVVADAGVDDDRLAARLDDEGVDRRDQATVGGRECGLSHACDCTASALRFENRKIGGTLAKSGDDAPPDSTMRDRDLADAPAKRRAHANALMVLTATLLASDDGSS